MIKNEIQQIFNKIEELIQNENYSGINNFINNFLSENLELTLYVSLLIATNRRKSKISDRWKLYEKARELAIEKCIIKRVPSEQIESDVNELLLELK